MYKHSIIIFLFMCLGASLSFAQSKSSKNKTMNSEKLEIATFGAGCFWCTEAVFQRLKGVEKVESGYAGGQIKNPTYSEICTGTTGHAEIAQITFDPSVISYEELLYVFWRTHDPTTLNQQGADKGTQYRSVVFYHSNAQKASAEKIMKETEAAKVWKNRIVTEISAMPTFYKAEEYHQNYYNQNSKQGYCVYVIDPKITKLYKEFGDKLKPEYSEKH
jgi:peptide-methionine (S)-S-oxide reductase